MIGESDTHFTDRVTQMELTIKGVKMIGNIVRRYPYILAKLGMVLG